MAQVDNQEPVKFLQEVLGEKEAAPILRQLETEKLETRTFSLLSNSLSSLDHDDDNYASDLKRAKLACRVASLCENKVKLARAVLDTDRDTLDLKTIIVKMDKTRLQQPENDDFVQFRRNAFKVEPTAVLHRMVLDKEVQVASSSTRNGLLKFFSNQPDFNMRSQSSLAALRHPDAFKDIPLKDRDQVALSLRKLQCTQALTTKPESVPVLLDAGLTSAFQVSSVPREAFVKSFETQLGHDETIRIHRHATASRARNEHALTGILQTIRGSGIAAVDGPGTIEDRKKSVAAAFRLAITGSEPNQDAPPIIDLESMFGGFDYCECMDCSSVTSPAAYFVELLQFLRNNNLSPSSTSVAGSTSPGIAGTALENLFARRPDLGCLELTCENTNTILPYVDLANEVMESFVVHRVAYERDRNSPKRASLDVYNIDDETTSEVLSQPQHTNYDAYCPLKDAVFPIVNAPYHQPLDEIRIFLEYLKTSRYELLTTFISEFQQKPRLSASDNQSLREEAGKAVERSATAEFWKMTSVEYIAITREHFWTKRYYELEQRRPISQKAYLSLIKRRSPWEYWGYSSQSAMEGEQDDATALSRVKKQFLWRSGLLYTELVEMVKTRYINSRYPADRDLQIFDSIHYSYQYLQSLVDGKASSPCKKYRRILTLLLRWKPWKTIKGTSKRCIPGDKMSVSRKELLCWLINWFDAIGNIIVLDSNERPQLPIQGYMVTVTIPERPQPDDPPIPADPVEPRLLGANGVLIPEMAVGAAAAIANPFLFQITGWLGRDGKITDSSNQLVGSVTPDSVVIDAAGVPLTSDPMNKLIFVFDRAIDQLGPLDQVPVDQLTQNLVLARVKPDTAELVWPVEFFSERVPTKLVEFMPTTETCNIDNVRLNHLNGTDLTPQEWDRMQVFVRLYRKLGWTVNEIDTAIDGLASSDSGSSHTPSNEDENETEWQHTLDVECPSCKNPSGSCGCSGGHTPSTSNGDCECDEECDLDCPSPPGAVALDVSPELLHDLIDVKRITDLSGLPLLQVLTIWTNISTQGNPSLYDSLFLKHSIYAMDPIFKQPLGLSPNFSLGKLSEHEPVIFAALGISLDGLTAIMEDVEMRDELTLANLSTLFRYKIMSRILGVKITLLPKVTALFGKAFGPGESASKTLKLIKDWQKMQERSFTFPQLNYIVKGNDDPLKAIGPAAATIFKAAKNIFDGLTKIDRENADFTDSDLAVLTAETVKSRLTLIYDSTVTDQIIALLDGTTVYSVQGPTGVNLTSTDLPKKAQYNPQTGILTVNGILTAAEIESLKGMGASNKEWLSAINKIGLQAGSFFDQYVSLIFEESKLPEARRVLLEGDIAAPPPSPAPSQPSTLENSQNTTSGATTPDPSTSGKKRSTFLHSFMSYLRRVLSERFVINVAAGLAGLNDLEMAKLLFTTIVKVEGKETALQALLSLRDPPSENSATLSASLIPPASGDYAFVVKGENITDLPDMKLDGRKILFTKGPDEASSTIWASDKINLINGQPYELLLSSGRLSSIQWKLENGPPSAVPSSAILPNYTQKPLREILTTTSKIGLLINNFQLRFDEISFFHENASDFGSIDFNDVQLDTWHRLADYTILRDAMPAMPKTLLGLFKWAKSPDENPLADMINLVTNWAKADIEAAISPNNFNASDPSIYKNEIQLSRLRKAIDLRKSVSVDIGTLFVWSQPTSFIWEDALANAANIRKQVRSQYDIDTWEKIAKPLFDTLRMNQRDALIAFLLVQEPLRTWGVTDADSLFEFFLIDVQMGACLQTSRIKQAISSVQIFVQRCLLDLERDQGSETVKAAQARYNGFMSGYRVWQANREVFLWPENWLDPALRDDKSSNFKALEAKLLQQDVKAQTVQDEIRGYVFRSDQVAHLDTIGLVKDDESDDVHFFGKSTSTPWTFFYRKYLGNGEWVPWEVIGVDIVTYDLNTENGALGHSGSYVLPVLWNSRLLLFLPEFAQKQVALSDDADLISMGNRSAKSSVAIWWEIKLAWTEYRNGAWTPKQITSQAIAKVPTIPIPSGQDPPKLPAVNNYQFVPRVVGTSPDTVVQIGVFNGLGAAVGWFNFDGGQVSVTNTLTKFELEGTAPTDFMFVVSDNEPKGKTMHSYQRSSVAQSTPGGSSEIITKLTLSLDKPSVFYPESDPMKPLLQMTSLPRDIKFYDSITHPLLARATMAPSVDGIFKYFEDEIDDSSKAEAFGNVESNFGPASDYDELKAPYALSNWEIGCHVPMLLMNKLLATQQFDEALKVAHYVFNPFAVRKTPPQPGDIWRWPPFKNVLAENALEVFFAKLKPNTIEASDSVIQKWRDRPFQPFVVARGRRQAMMRWFAVQYIRTLIAYGDYYFMQFTLETIPLAIQLYIQASHIYGKRAQKIPKRGKKKAQSYNSLLDKWDAFSNAVVQLELAFPFSNQIDQPTGRLYDEELMANLFGFGTSRYFCIPNNLNLTAVRDLIDDRLYKIRHCKDINGVFRIPPLFEPKIDPGLLVQAAAAGISIASALSDLNSPMPNYRFFLLLQKALELCGELKGLSGQYLSTKEKIDNEILANIRARQETVVSGLVMNIKKQALDEANASLNALHASRASTEYKMRHFLNLLGEAVSKIPDEKTDFSELDEMIEAPAKTNNTYKLIGFEIAELSKSLDANNLNSTIGTIEALAGALHIIPNTDLKALPWGLGVGLRWGAENFAIAASAVARQMKVGADTLSYESTNSGRMATYLRQVNDRIHQVNTAGYEIKNLDAQLKTQIVRIGIAEREISNQQTAIDNANEVMNYLKNKYTNLELYSWMDDNLKTLHYQTYTLAYQIAKKAERAYCFERGVDPATSNFISFGYWNASRNGILAGENLMLGLKQLEAAYHETRGYDFEITRHVSLRQLSPLSLFDLRENAWCEFVIPELFFDMDFPGHYQRLIRTVSLSIPCVVGPYTSISCTLRLLNSEYRMNPIATDKGSYPKSTDGDDPRFRTVSTPVSSIAVSTAQADSGMFEVNFRDERYMPFEGAGVSSRWRLELPSNFRQWDYGTINDVVVHMRYTSKDGGAKLGGVAADAVSDFVHAMIDLSQDQGLFALFDLRSEFASDWARVITPPLTSTGQIDPNGMKTITLSNLYSRLPAYTRGTDSSKIIASDVYLLLTTVKNSSIQATLVTADGTETVFKKGSLTQPTTEMMVLQVVGADTPMTTWKIQFKGTWKQLGKGYVIVKYKLLP